MSSKTSSSSVVRRELPFAAKLVVLCVLSATMGAMLAAYRTDGHLEGFRTVTHRQLAMAQGYFSAKTQASDAIIEPHASGETEALFDKEISLESDFDSDDSEPSELPDEEDEGSERRQLGTWPFCGSEKSKLGCRNRAMNLQVPCSWRNGRCKYRPGATIPQKPPLEGDTLAPTPAPARIQNCIDDVSQCPGYPSGRMLADWKVRFTNAVCAPEKGFYNPKCLEVCTTLFDSYSGTVPWGDSILKSCSIGCMYAKNMYAKKLPGSTCMTDCKNTVWHFEASAGKCRYPYGLGIAVTDALHPEVLGAGKACEIGCLAGNDRPCPALNLAAGWLP